MTCFSLPSEPRAIALVFKKDSTDGYYCACLMLNDVYTSLSVSSRLYFNALSVLKYKSCTSIKHSGLASLGDTH